MGSRPQEWRPFLAFCPEASGSWRWGVAFLVGAGSLGYPYWKFSSLVERFEELQRASEKLARRRDQGMVDLISLSQGVSQLCSQLDNLHGDLAGRPAHDVQKSLQEGGLADYFNSQSVLSEAAVRTAPAGTRWDPLPLEEAPPPTQQTTPGP